jgi:heparin binding hemagglutinin HbhA
MPNLPTPEELRKAGEQAAAAARTPLLAALGAGDLAAKAVVEALNKARSAVNERAETAKSAVDELPGELNGLRDRLDPAELRKLVDAYTQSAVQLYSYLAEQGEQTLEKLRAQPQVRKAFEQVEEAAGDAREIADDVLGKVTRRTRSVGEKVADATDDASEKIAEKIEEAGGDVAHEVRNTTRKTAARTAPRKTASATTTASTRNNVAKKPSTGPSK